MNYYFLRDDYDNKITGLIITNKDYDEVQEIIDKAKNESDVPYDNIMSAFEKNRIKFIIKENVDSVMW